MDATPKPDEPAVISTFTSDAGPGDRRPTRAWMVRVLAPIAGSLVASAIAALLATSFSSHQSELMVLAAASAALAGVLAVRGLRGQIAMRRAAFADLRSVEARVSDIVESAMDPIITLDGQRRVVMFNRAAECEFGRPRATVLGQPFELLFPERFRAPDGEHPLRFDRESTPHGSAEARGTLCGLRADGREFPVEISISRHDEGDRRFHTIILRDISERLRGEARVRLSEARLRGILDSAMDAIITIDERQDVVMFNRAAEDMFRCPRELALKTSIASFIPERLRGAHASHVRQFGETGTQSRRMGGLRIVTGLRRDAEEFPIDASISQVIEGDARFYTVILRDVSARVRAEVALRRSKEELQELAIAAHMIREQEKSRIARELHDELGQALTMLQMDVAWARETGPPGDTAFAARLDRMAVLLTSTIQATRRIAADLRPLMLDDLGLVPAIEWLVQNFSQRTGVPCALRIGDPELDLPALQSSAVFRIVQESLTNVAKHAQASHADVSIDHGDGMLTIRVRDDGAGFSPDDPRKPNSFGLFGLRERAALLAGTATIESATGRGTTIEVRLPTAAPVPTP